MDTKYTIKTGIFNIHGCWIKVTGNHRILNHFELYFGNFKASDFDHFFITIEPSFELDPLPIRIKGGGAGIDIFMVNNRKFPSVKILYNNFLQGADYDLLVNYTRFLLYWHDKCQAHAGAVVKDGKSYVFFAPQNTGKTTLVLYLLKMGYSLLSDDWVIIGKDGNAYFYPQPINIYDYNLAYSIDWCKEFYGWKARLVQLMMLLRVKFKEKIVPIIPNRIARFGIDWALSKAIKMIPQNITDNNHGKIHKVFWLNRDRNFNTLLIKEIENEDLINRATATFMYEFSEYFRWYYLVAQKGKRIMYIENFKDHIKEILKGALKDISCNEVLIPLHTSPQELGEAILTNISL